MFRKVRRVCKIDYVKREARNKEWIERLKTADSIDSNHYSVVVWVKDRKRKGERNGKKTKIRKQKDNMDLRRGGRVRKKVNGKIVKGWKEREKCKRWVEYDKEKNKGRKEKKERKGRREKSW